MSAADYKYDGSGTSADNLVENELHTLDVNVNRSVIPSHHPFFGTSLVVEGKKTASSNWETLDPELDYFFSPLFINGSARATGQEIFSYIVMIEDVVQVRIKYQALGQYEDSKLMAEVATATFDRSIAGNWGKIIGNAATYTPNIQDPSLTEKSTLEAVNLMLEKIRIAIANPYTSDANMRQQVTDLQEKFALLPTADEIYEGIISSSVRVTVDANIVTPILTVPADKNMIRGVVYFQSEDGLKREAYDTIIMDTSDEPKVAAAGFVTTETIPETSVSATKVGSSIRLFVKAPRAGTFSFKTLCVY